MNGDLTVETLTEVCYILSGNLRGQSIFMRGCEAMPMMNSSDSEEYLPEEYLVWFETENGREYVEDKSLFICNTDFCNNRHIIGGTGINLSLPILIVFAFFLENLFNLMFKIKTCFSLESKLSWLVALSALRHIIYIILKK